MHEDQKTHGFTKSEKAGIALFYLYLLYDLLTPFLTSPVSDPFRFIKNPGNWLSFLVLLGALFRKSWARKLWVTQTITGFIYILIYNYWSRPYSKVNSPVYIAWHVLWLAAIVWVYRTQWLARFLNRKGHKFWLRIGTGYCVLILTGLITIMTATYLWTGQHPVEKIKIPAFSQTTPLPTGWTETECFDYIIPVPAAEINQAAVEDEGNTLRYKEMVDTNMVRLAMISTEITLPLHKALAPNFGTDTLAKYYSLLYEKRLSMPYTLETWTRYHMDERSLAVGFFSKNDTDMMVEFVEEPASQKHVVVVSLEHPTTGEYLQINLQQRKPWPREERIALVSRIRHKP